MMPGMRCCRKILLNDEVNCKMIVGIIGYYFVESPNFAANKKGKGIWHDNLRVNYTKIC